MSQSYIDEETQLAQAIANSLADGVDDINSDLYRDFRLQMWNEFIASLEIAKQAILRTAQLRLGAYIDLTDVYTFTMENVAAIPYTQLATRHVAERITTHPGTYDAIAVDDIIFRQIDCGSLAFDHALYVIDSNTCLYNCVYIWLTAQKMINEPLPYFIERVNKKGGITRERGDFGDELVMKAMCDLYNINICCMWKSANAQRISFISGEYSKKLEITTSICYLVNEHGTIHFKLLIPDL